MRSALRVAWLVSFAALVATGCGDNKPPPKSGDWTDNLKPVDPNAKPELGDDDDDAPDPAPEPAPEAPKPAPTATPSSGRPMIQYGPKASIESTFGVTPGSKLTLTGGLTLVIPEFALDTGYNILFKVAGSSAHKKGPVVGSIGYLKVTPGTKLQAVKVTGKKASFEIRVGTGAAETVNLALGEVATDNNGDESGKPTWTVLAPKRVDKAVGIVDGKETEERTAVFEIPTIGPVLYFHATTAGPS